LFAWALARRLLPERIRRGRMRRFKAGQGKRGGPRIVYYGFLAHDQIWLLTLFDMSEAADLTKVERDQFRCALEAERAARKERGRR
jgi:hypothetical protein